MNAPYLPMPRRGATLIEYGLVLALVAVVVIGVVTTVGSSVRDTFTSADSALSGSGEAPPAPAVVFSGTFAGECTLGGSFPSSANCPTAGATSDHWATEGDATYTITMMIRSTDGDPVIPMMHFRDNEFGSISSAGLPVTTSTTFVEVTQTGLFAPEWTDVSYFEIIAGNAEILSVEVTQE